MMEKLSHRDVPLSVRRPHIDGHDVNRRGQVLWYIVLRALGIFDVVILRLFLLACSLAALLGQDCLDYSDVLSQGLSSLRMGLL